jgi:ATP-binding cassette, subfamily C, bacterial CydD
VRRRLALAVGSGLAAVAILVVAALVMSDVVASVFLGGTGLVAVAPALAALAALAVARAVFLGCQDMLAQRASDRLRRRLRTDLSDRVFDMGPAYTSTEHSGELVAVMTGGLDAIDVYVASFQPARLIAVLAPVFILVVVAVLDPPTAIVLLLTGPVLVLLLSVIGGRAGVLSERRFGELRWMSAFFLDLLQGLSTLKMFGRSAEQVTSIRDVSRRFGETTMEVLRTAFQTALVLEWGAAVAMAVVAVEVSLRLMTGSIGFERALAVLIICPEFFFPLRQLAVRYHTGSAGRTASERIQTILGDTQGTGPAPADRRVGHGQRRVEAPTIVLEDVSLTYPGRDVPALADLSLTIGPGRRTALVGTTGAGKSTVIGLLMRFVDPDRGRVLVDGVDLSTIDIATWRSMVAWVPQAPHLFHGTVADNLRLGRSDATPEAMVRAAVDADAHAFILGLPGGYDAPIGEDGIRLSGGQRQRLALARAILRDTPFIVLDEPTAHLDDRSEAAVVATLERMSRTRTILIVSHRPRLAATAETVAVLEKGRVIESGPLGDLLAREGPFRRLMTDPELDGSVR